MKGKKWMKKQITELLPYKTKYVNLELENTGFKNQLNLVNDQLDKSKYSLSLMEKLCSEKDVKMMDKNEYVSSIEAKLSDVKDFVYRNCPEKLDELLKNYKI